MLVLNVDGSPIRMVIIKYKQSLQRENCMCPTEFPWVFIGKYKPFRKYTYLLQTNILSIRFIPLPKFHFVFQFSIGKLLYEAIPSIKWDFCVCVSLPYYGHNHALKSHKLSYFRHQVLFCFLSGVKETMKEIGINIS